MGWFLRKSFGIGPIRLNLSKSGFGLSAGIKGLRIGTGPRGRYIHGGREGLYYRQSLQSRSKPGELAQEPMSEDTEVAAIERREEQVQASQETTGSSFWSAFWRRIFGGLMRGR